MTARIFLVSEAQNRLRVPPGYVVYLPQEYRPPKVSLCFLRTDTKYLCEQAEMSDASCFLPRASVFPEIFFLSLLEV